MKLAILLTTSMILVPLIISALVLGVAAPTWLLLAALLFAMIIISAGVMGQWIGILLLILARAILIPLALALVVIWGVAFAQTVATTWIFWPILVAAVIALIIGLTDTHENPRVRTSAVSA